MSRLNMLDARCTALFASGLQRSDAPDGDAVARAVRLAVRQYGVCGCAPACPGPKPAGCSRHAA